MERKIRRFVVPVESLEGNDFIVMQADSVGEKDSGKRRVWNAKTIFGGDGSLASSFMGIGILSRIAESSKEALIMYSEGTEPVFPKNYRNEDE